MAGRAQILLRAMAEPDFRDLLFADFGQAVANYALDEAEKVELAALSRADLEGLAGRMFIHLITPIRVGPRMVVIPSACDDLPLTESDIPIWLEPRFAFGNGAHETTRATLIALEKHIRPGDRVLDLGVGTGIQSIAAIRLGARSALGLDINAEAVEIARQNFRRNCVEGCAHAEIGSLADILDNTLRLRDPHFDLIIANILSPVILEFLKQGIARALRPGGRLIVSGIQQANLPVIQRALPAAGLRAIDCLQEGTWTALALRRAPVLTTIRRFFEGG